MTPRRFEWALRTRGPDIARWPGAEHDAALLLLRRSDEARRALADALATEDAPTPDAPALLRMQSVVRRALAPPPPVMRGIRLGALAACVAAGLYVGLAPVEERPLDLAPTVQANSLATVLAALDR